MGTNLYGACDLTPREMLWRNLGVGVYLSRLARTAPELYRSTDGDILVEAGLRWTEDLIKEALCLPQH